MSLDIQDQISATVAIPATYRRGPLRPERLVSVRKREHRRLASHGFRLVDTALLIAVTTALLIRDLDQPVLRTPLIELIPAIVGVWTVWLMLSGLRLYRFGNAERLSVHLLGVWLSTLAGGGAALLLRRLGVGESTTDSIVELFVTCGVLTSLLHLSWWGLVRRWRRSGLLTPNIVVVGATAHAEELVGAALDRRDLNIVGIFEDRRDRSPSHILDVPVLGTVDDLLRHRTLPYVDLIVVALDHTAVARVNEVNERLDVLPNTVTLMFDQRGADRRAAAIDRIADSPLAPLHAVSDDGRRAFAKRVQDLAIGITALVLLAPAMALIALLIRLDSPGPVFFKQRREGFNNEEILVWKFRTMRHDAADARAERQVTADDDRVTRIGRRLRTTSLDELPQLFNVVRGEMSLVGPRPHAIGMKTGEIESARLVARYAHRHRIKPGMTGWAAVNGSRGPLHEASDVIRRVELDIEYIERQSGWFDLQIMARTIPSMMGDRSAVR